MERILERVSSESRAQLSFKDVAGLAGRDSMYENVDAGYETTDHKASCLRDERRLGREGGTTRARREFHTLDVSLSFHSLP